MSQRIRKTSSSLWSTFAVFCLAFIFYASCYAHMK